MGSKQESRVAQAAKDPIKPRRSRTTRQVTIRSVVGSGAVLQVVHDYDCSMTVGEAGRLLADIARRSAREVKLVLTGGGFLWFDDVGAVPCDQRTAEGLSELRSSVFSRLQPLIDCLRKATLEHNKDFVVGIDVYFGDDDQIGGQFALYVGSQSLDGKLIHKILPVGNEEQYLAGFGSNAARREPHVIDTVLGKTMILVCHDAQAFNRLTWARINNASQTTWRRRAAVRLRREAKRDRPAFALNLIHWVETPSNLQTFQRSQKQLCADHLPEVVCVGAFGTSLQALTNNDVVAWADSIRRSDTGRAIALVY